MRCYSGLLIRAGGFSLTGFDINVRLISQINKVNKRIINRLSEFVKLSFRVLDLRRSGFSDGLWVVSVYIQWITELRFWKLRGDRICMIINVIVSITDSRS